MSNRSHFTSSWQFGLKSSSKFLSRALLSSYLSISCKRKDEETLIRQTGWEVMPERQLQAAAIHIFLILPKERMKENWWKQKQDRIEEEMLSVDGRSVLKEYQGQF